MSEGEERSNESHTLASLREALSRMSDAQFQQTRGVVVMMAELVMAEAGSRDDLTPVYRPEDIPTGMTRDETAAFWETHSITPELWDALTNPESSE